MALLPFFLKSLFFLAIKSLIAGKAALILVVYHLLKNAKTGNENDKVTVSHYGYKEGEEYGAWINRRNYNVDQQSSTTKPPEIHYKRQQLKLRSI